MSETPRPPASSPPSFRARWAERAAAMACGAALFAGGVVTADLLSPGTPAVGRARADGPALSIREANRLRADLAAEQSRPLIEGGAALARVARLASPSLVHIEARYPDPADGRMVEETGSGVLARHPRWPVHDPADPGRSRLFVLTNRHVVAGAGADGIALKLSDGKVVFPERVWLDPETDLGVLEIPSTDLPSIKFGDSDALEPGHFVMTLGSPFGLENSVSLGIISAKGRRRLDLGSKALINQEFLQTDAGINPGNSGGPLVDLQGRLVGINTAIASESGGSERVGFSIPSGLVRRVFDELLTHGRVRRGYLGVTLDNQYDRLAALRAGLDRQYGALVDTVKRGTPAAAAGLKRGDVVLKFGNVEVQDNDHLIHLVSLTNVGESVRLTVLRDGRPVPLALTLAERARTAEARPRTGPAPRR